MFGVSAWTTSSQSHFTRLSSLAGIWALVLAALVAATAMITWSIRASRIKFNSSRIARSRWRIISARDCQPSDVRVHASTGPISRPPLYVKRDHDDTLTLKLRAAEKSGGFILLIGGSSTGKSRSLLNSIQDTLGDWNIFIPDDSAALREADRSGSIPPKSIIWLDDSPVEVYITASEDGLSGNDIRRLLSPSRQIIVIDSMWPERFEALMANPIEPADVESSHDPSRGARDALAMADDPIRVGEQLSSSERIRAQLLAKTDDRLQTALNDSQFGFTQSLAGAPALVRRYEDAETAEPYAYALMKSAADSRIVGNFSLLPDRLLREAAPGYLSGRQRADLVSQSAQASTHKFNTAFRYATNLRALPGNVSPLIPQPFSSTSGAIGYTIADYLLQYIEAQRRYSLIPQETWESLLLHTSRPADLMRIARSAESRLLYSWAEKFTFKAYGQDPHNAAPYLTQWLLKHDHIDQLRQLADTGSTEAQERIAEWLVRKGSIGELRERAGRGERGASKELSNWMAASGQLAELKQRAEAGDEFAATWFPQTASERNLFNKVRALYPPNDASKRLADRLYDTGQIDELRELANLGDLNGRKRLAIWLVRNQEIDELRRRADAGDGVAHRRLVDWLLDAGRIDELRERSDSGDKMADRPLAELLLRNGEFEELRQRADQGNGSAGWRLAKLLISSGNIEELRLRAEAGDRHAGPSLANWLSQNGRYDELRELADLGNEYACQWLAEWLMESGNVDELHERAKAGDHFASIKYRKWLHKNRSMTEIRALVASGAVSSEFLTEIIYEGDQIDELRSLAETGDQRARSRLAKRLARHGLFDELRIRAASGDREASAQLIRSAKSGEVLDSGRLLRYGLKADGSIDGDSRASR